MPNNNTLLGGAKIAKKDEFYTQLSDIERELSHYREHFRGKVVLCNCDDPYESNFFKYFCLQFNTLGLKRLICTCYKGSPVAYKQLNLFGEVEDDEEPTKPHDKKAYKVVINEIKDYNGDGAVDLSDVEWLLKNDKNTSSELKTGDFRSPECIELLKASDIVVTNPPFSLFREYVAQLMEYGKKFIIVAKQNNAGYKEIFPYFMQNKMWFGYGFNGNVGFFTSPYEDKAKSSQHKKDKIRVSGVTWFTNLEIPKTNEPLDLYKKYTPEEYCHYDNYDAIDVKNTADIPCDYDGIMGVPITFFEKYCPKQFEIIGSNCSTEECKKLGVKPLGEEWIKKYKQYGGTGHNTANMVRVVYTDKTGKPKVAFSRIFIRRRHPLC